MRRVINKRMACIDILHVRQEKIYIIKQIRECGSTAVVTYDKISMDDDSYYFSSFLGNSHAGTFGWKSKSLKEALKRFLDKNDENIGRIHEPNHRDLYEIFEFDDFEEVCEWYLSLPEKDRMRKWE